ncbi:TPA: hypothetical protein HA249_04295 [Candidatus Woesearchaeota archaeon]|nr:hypothetical protein [Candidatus Woesearchaeota archaeon]
MFGQETRASLREAYQRGREAGIRFYTRTEVLGVLEQLGIPSLIKVYNPNTFLEYRASTNPPPTSGNLPPITSPSQ